jgi:hypothetical protein
MRKMMKKISHSDMEQKIYNICTSIFYMCAVSFVYGIVTKEDILTGISLFNVLCSFLLLVCDTIRFKIAHDIENFLEIYRDK